MKVDEFMSVLIANPENKCYDTIKSLADINFIEHIISGDHGGSTQYNH